MYRPHDVQIEYAAETFKIIRVYRLPLTSTQAYSLNVFINNKYYPTGSRKTQSEQFAVANLIKVGGYRITYFDDA